MDLTVGIVNWNTRELLHDCLRSVLPQRPRSIIVVDNDSTDGSAALVLEEFPEVRLVRNPSNLGYAAAANQILELVEGEWVLLLNTDTVVREGAVEALDSFMRKHPDAAVAGPRIVNPDGSVQYSCRNFPTFGQSVIHGLLGAVLPSNPYSRAYKLADWDHADVRTVDWVSGAAMCLRIAAAVEVGNFDEGYFMYVEDLDLCYRLRERGWQVYYVPQAEVMHYIGRSSDKQSLRMIAQFQMSLYRFYSKMNSRGWKRMLKPAVAGGLAMRGSLLVAQELVRRPIRRLKQQVLSQS